MVIELTMRLDRFRDLPANPDTLLLKTLAELYTVGIQASGGREEVAPRAGSVN